MKRNILFIAAVMFAACTNGQHVPPDSTHNADVALITNDHRATPDMIQTSKGPLTIQPVFHAAIVLTWNGKTVYVDPYNGANGYKGLAAPALVLITHAHPDHLDVSTLNALDLSNARLIVPKVVYDQLSDALKEKSIVLNNGDKQEQFGMTINAIPAYNLRESSLQMHPKGVGNGYVLEMGDKRIYIAGDTEDIPEMRSLKNIDVSFVCMNLPYTMDIEHAESAVLEFKPKIVYPYHYRGQDGFSDVQSFKKIVNEKDKTIDVRLRDWYPKS